MRKGLLFALLVCVAVMFASGCATTSVKRMDVAETVDLSGKWNDTDSRMVSEEMIKDCLNRPWLAAASSKSGKPPVVIVGTVVNQSREHISTQTFTKDLERAFINSGQVDFVASKSEREEIRDERLDQSKHAAEETAKEAGQETGADYMMKGVISSITDQVEGKSVVFYQVNLELIDLKNNRKAWIGEKKIKKFVSQSRFGL